MLAPPIGLSVVRDVVARLPVVADSGDVRSMRCVGHRPELEIYGLTCEAVGQVIQWHSAIARAIVLAVRDEMGVVAERDARMLVPSGQPQFRRYRIGLDVHACG